MYEPGAAAMPYDMCCKMLNSLYLFSMCKGGARCRIMHAARGTRLAKLSEVLFCGAATRV